MSISKILKTVLCIALLVCIVALFSVRGALSRFAWRSLHQPRIALALDQDDAGLAMEIGNYYFGAAPLGATTYAYDPDLAKTAFEKALAIQPGILWGHYSLARIYFTQGDLGHALAEINAELTAHPQNLRSLYVRGLIYGFRDRPGDLALAEADFRTFTRWAPTEWAGYNDLSWILLKEGKYQGALSTIVTALANVPDASTNPWLLNDQGLAYLNIGDDTQAANAFSKTLAVANLLSESDWRRAYSGDSPASDQQGLAAFKAGIEANLAKANGA